MALILHFGVEMSLWRWQLAGRREGTGANRILYDQEQRNHHTTQIIQTRPHCPTPSPLDNLGTIGHIHSDIYLHVSFHPLLLTWPLSISTGRVLCADGQCLIPSVPPCVCSPLGSHRNHPVSVSLQSNSECCLSWCSFCCMIRPTSHAQTSVFSISRSRSHRRRRRCCRFHLIYPFSLFTHPLNPVGSSVDHSTLVSFDIAHMCTD